mmetsp:Transcript_94755/g.267508  ORF Transcript_94755/g.267508 Transcript_94755/m.267508 type:complete len:302 (+) Transcript_94755:61-966(+)
MASGASQRRSFRRVGSAPKDSGLALNAPSEPSVKAWRPVVPEVLRKLASGMRLADRSVNAQQYWRWSCTQAATGTGQPTSQQLVDFLCCVVPYEELATLVHRLQRRTAGLGGLWYEFCDQHGMRASDPYTAEAVPLLEFVCVAIERAPDRVVLLKRPSKYTPFVALAVQCAMERLEQNSCRSPTGNVPRPRSARLLCGERGKWQGFAAIDPKTDVEPRRAAGVVVSESSAKDGGFRETDLGASCRTRADMAQQLKQVLGIKAHHSQARAGRLSSPRCFGWVRSQKHAARGTSETTAFMLLR